MSASSSSDEEAEEYEEPLYLGKRNSDGLPHGRGTLKWVRLGNRFEGRFVDGSKEGKGCYYFSDGSTLSGSYRNDKLEGEALYTYADGSYMMADFRDGEMEGRFREYFANGSIAGAGANRNGRRTGVLYTFDEYGGSVVGLVDKNGCLTGDEIAYIYPDERTALIGRFEDGLLVKGWPANLETTLDKSDYGLDKLPAFSFRDDYLESVGFDASTSDHLSLQPLVSDVYEQDRVCVGKSLIKNAGEGLFAKVNLKEDEVASFYNGIRLSHDEVDSRDWLLNENTLSLDEDVVIDVPVEYSDTARYCATLGHKANHSNNPNCKYDFFNHPRYAIIILYIMYIGRMTVIESCRHSLYASL